MATLQLRCACASVQGQATLGRGRQLRLACYCRDCQAYAWFLDADDPALDPNGGTEILQTSPARVEFSTGSEHLACMRMSPKGPMRWYAKCCNTALGNTLAKANFPFLGLSSSVWDPELDEAGRDALLGPVRGRVNGPGYPDASGNLAAVDKFPALAIARSLRLLAGSWLRNEHWPTPFFDAEGNAIVEAQILSLEAREALQAKVSTRYSSKSRAL